MVSTSPSTAVGSGPLRSRRSVLSNVIPPTLGRPESAAASVFAVVRQQGPIARDAIATTSGLSIATVNRQITALVDAQLLRERPDLAVAGAIGRPRIPVEVNHDQFLTLGLHIGARSTSIVAVDLLGRTLDAVETPTPGGAQETALASLADSARRYLSRWHRRRPLWIGIATGGVVDSVSGHVNHARLGWSQAAVGPVLARALGIPVSIASHVDAIAGAELLLGKREQPDSASSLYLYARETVGFAQVIGGRVYTPLSGPGTIAGLPVQSELLGGNGQLESTVSDEAVLVAARKSGILTNAGPHSSMATLLRIAKQNNGSGADSRAAVDARELLGERARILGGVAALLRDMLNPEDIVVGGQAFSDYPEGLRQVRAAFAERSLLPPRDIRLTGFGSRVQEAGAGVVSLSSLYADPLGSLRRARSRRPESA